jgi:vacuolar-type H+-ATPase subunit I/STV1
MRQAFIKLFKLFGHLVLIFGMSALVAYLTDTALVSVLPIMALVYVLGVIIDIGWDIKLIAETLRQIDKRVSVNSDELNQVKFEINSLVIRDNLEQIKRNNEKIDELNKEQSKQNIEFGKLVERINDTEPTSDGTQRVELTGMTHCCDEELDKVKDELIADSKRLDRMSSGITKD